MGGRER